MAKISQEIDDAHLFFNPLNNYHVNLLPQGGTFDASDVDEGDRLSKHRRQNGNDLSGFTIRCTGRKILAQSRVSMPSWTGPAE